MSGAAYYNENDPAAAHVLRALIAEGLIAPGDVDARSIKDVPADDLRGYTQCHFFAGMGGWSVAARIAGWPDDRPLWSASCPCQPFSAAGKGAGMDDPRHLWPDLFRLIRAARPEYVVGEQVSGKAGYGWLDGVRADLASEGYASEAVDIPACAIDAPHQRNRLYWIAMGDGIGAGLEGQRGHGDASGRTLAAGSATASDGRNGDGLLADADASRRLQPERGVGEQRGRAGDGADRRNGSFWSDFEWLICHDEKARRAKPGIRLLVDGMVGRIDLWRLAGNGIVLPLAAEVIGALMDVLDERRTAA